jgi:hypothetical protein
MPVGPILFDAERLSGGLLAEMKAPPRLPETARS